MDIEAYSGLRKFVAPEFIFGVKARNLLPQYIRNIGGNRVLLVTDPGIIAAGWIEDVTALLEEASIRYEIYSDITPNPKDYEVMKGSEEYRKKRCDLITAVGGGSVIDCAKGIGIVCTNKGHITDFEGVDRILNPIPPMICIPTTAGTSADISQFAVITNCARKVKFGIVGKSVIPDVSLIDPETTLTMDRELTIHTGLDAFVHAVEAIASTASSSITDVHALKAIEIIHGTIRKVVDELHNIELRTAMMLASVHAGMAFSNTSLGLIHAMAHSLGGYKDFPHGQCNSILLPYIVEYNYESAAAAYVRMGRSMGIPERFETADDHKKALLKELESMLRYLNIEKGIKGLSSDDIHQLAENAYNDQCIATNPKYPSKKDIEKLYDKVCEKNS